MKKTLLMLFAAAAFVGCEQGEQINEPAGAERDMQMEQRDDTDTNTVTDPSGAQQQPQQDQQQRDQLQRDLESDTP